MTRRLLVVIAAALSTVTAGALASQDKPNFSGNWTLEGNRRQDIPTTGRPVTYLAPYSEAFTLKQDARTLTIDISTGDRLLSVTLDGSPSKVARQDGVEVAYTAAWNGPKLVTTARWVNNDVRGEPTRTFWLDSNGSLLIEMRANPGSPTATFVYKKSGKE